MTLESLLVDNGLVDPAAIAELGYTGAANARDAVYLHLWGGYLEPN